MPILDIFKSVEGEADDSPKKFTNIDTEGFQFTWDGKPFGGVFPERMRSHQETRTNTDRKEESYTVYEFVKDILPGETVVMPKYLVRYAAVHLARKIYKRQCFAAFQGTEYEKRNAAIRFVNPVEELKLIEKIVASNFPDEKPQEPEVPTARNVVDQSKVEPAEVKTETFKCELCEFEAKSKLGLSAHKRFKHKKVEIPQS